MLRKFTQITFLILLLCFISLLLVLKAIAVPPSSTYKNVILFSLDGCQWDHFYELYEGGQLGNIATLISEGSLSKLYITSHITHTDPGHAAMLTGYGGPITGVKRNGFDIVPEGDTIFERLKELNQGTATGFITGRHSDKDPQGEPPGHGFPTVTFSNALNTNDLDAFIDPYYSYYNMYWGPFESGYPLNSFLQIPYHVNASAVADKALEFIDYYQNNVDGFFLFVHFTNPDYAGHLYGENSSEYENSIIKNDEAIGRIMTYLKNHGLYGDTAIIVTTDHGWYENGYNHTSYPIGSDKTPKDEDCYTTFMVCNKVELTEDPIVKGIQEDNAATVYALMGVDATSFGLNDGVGHPAVPIWERDTQQSLFAAVSEFSIPIIEMPAKQLTPKGSALFQNYPQPFNPETWIPYQLAEDSEVVIKIYDIAGRLVQTLDLKRKKAGFYLNKDKAAYWDGRNSKGEQIASGIYFYTIEAGRFRAVRKLLMVN